MKDASSPNVWISSKQAQEKSNIKPSDNDRKISLKLGGIGENYLLNLKTLQEQKPSACKTKQAFERYVRDGAPGIFEYYKSLGRPGYKSVYRK